MKSIKQENGGRESAGLEGRAQDWPPSPLELGWTPLHDLSRSTLETMRVEVSSGLGETPCVVFNWNVDSSEWPGPNPRRAGHPPTRTAQSGHVFQNPIDPPAGSW